MNASSLWHLTVLLRDCKSRRRKREIASATRLLKRRLASLSQGSAVHRSKHRVQPNLDIRCQIHGDTTGPRRTCTDDEFKQICPIYTRDWRFQLLSQQSARFRPRTIVALRPRPARQASHVIFSLGTIAPALLRSSSRTAKTGKAQRTSCGGKGVKKI